MHSLNEQVFQHALSANDRFLFVPNLHVIESVCILVENNLPLQVPCVDDPIQLASVEQIEQLVDV
jgi:hypothetical protein